MLPFVHIGIFFGVLTIIFFLKKPVRLSHITASVFLIFLCVPLLMKLILLKGMNIPAQSSILNNKSYLFTYGPLLYLYTKFTILENPVFRKKYFLHFIPFIIFTILLFINPVPEMIPPDNLDIINPPKDYILNPAPPPYPPVPGEDYLPLKKPHADYAFTETPEEINFKSNLLNSFLLLSFISYTALIFNVLVKHKRYISENFSFDSIGPSFKHLQWLAVCFVLSYSSVGILRLTTTQSFMNPLLDRRIAPDVAISFYISVFCFLAITQPVIFKSVKGEEGYSPGKKDKKYEKSGLRAPEATNYLNLLEEFMNNKKPYLDSNLTITNLSEMLGIQRHHLTQIINEKLNKNFFMYVNGYRVKEAKQMMLDKRYNDYTVLRIAYESGFNSKSGFNSAFKKFTGYTPREFKKNLPPDIQIHN